MIPTGALTRLQSGDVDYDWLEALTDWVEAAGHDEQSGRACASALDGFIARTQDDELIESGLNCMHSLLNTLSEPFEIPGVVSRLGGPEAEQAVNCLGSSGVTGYVSLLRPLTNHSNRGVASAARIALGELGAR